MAELSQEELEQRVQGKPADPNVCFFERTKLDPVESRKQNRRVYVTHLYIKKTYPGVNDYVPRLASKSDLEQYPREYRNFQMSKKSSSPSIELVPGLSEIEKAELRDLGVLTVEALAKAQTVPPHLQDAQRMACALHAAMEAENDGSQSEQKEDHPREEEGRQAEESLALARPFDGGHEQQPELPAGVGNSEGGGASEGRGEGGPVNGHHAGHERKRKEVTELIASSGADFSFEVRVQ